MARNQRSDVRRQRSAGRFRILNFGSRTSAGFTLLELLVVIVVIGILLAILLPAFKDMRAKAKAQETSTTSVAFDNATHAFYVEYGYYPGQELSPPQNLIAGVIITNYLLSTATKNTKGLVFWE